jgi:hypothetical protein
MPKRKRRQSNDAANKRIKTTDSQQQEFEAGKAYVSSLVDDATGLGLPVSRIIFSFLASTPDAELEIIFPDTRLEIAYEIENEHKRSRTFVLKTAVALSGDSYKFSMRDNQQPRSVCRIFDMRLHDDQIIRSRGQFGSEIAFGYYQEDSKGQINKFTIDLGHNYDDDCGACSNADDDGSPRQEYYVTLCGGKIANHCQCSDSSEELAVCFVCGFKSPDVDLDNIDKWKNCAWLGVTQGEVWPQAPNPMDLITICGTCAMKNNLLVNEDGTLHVSETKAKQFVLAWPNPY